MALWFVFNFCWGRTRGKKQVKSCQGCAYCPLLSQALYEYLFLNNLKLDMIVVTNCFCLENSPTYNQRNFKAKKVKRRYLQTNNVSSYSWLDNCNVNLTCSICNLCCTLWILIHVLKQNSLKSTHTTVLCQQ